MGFVVGEVDANVINPGGSRNMTGAAAQWVNGHYSEAGIGALVPWADKLWFINYPDQNDNGRGLGLYVMDDKMKPKLVAETNVTSAARCTIADQLFIGVHAIDTSGNVTPITGFGANDRITAYTKLFGSSNLWAMTMDGNIWKIDPATKVATFQQSNGGLNIVGQPHGKGLWGHPAGRYLYAVLNGHSGNGRLASFDTQTLTWTTIDTNSWVEVSGSYDGNQYFFATGHDFKSALFYMFDPVTYTATPKKYRIPLSSRQQLHAWQQEWMRIRATETERYLMDLHGGFYQLSIAVSNQDDYATGFPLIEPVCRHMRTIPDFGTWNGRLVLASNQATPQSGNKYTNVGQPQSGLLMITQDDLWSWGKPAGTGFWYQNEAVTANVASDPMLMRGYDKKVLHLANGGASSVRVKVEIFINHRPFTYTTVTVAAGAYEPFVFPDGFAADWVRVTPLDASTDFTAGVIYS